MNARMRAGVAQSRCPCVQRQSRPLAAPAPFKRTALVVRAENWWDKIGKGGAGGGAAGAGKEDAARKAIQVRAIGCISVAHGQSIISSTRHAPDERRIPSVQRSSEGNKSHPRQSRQAEAVVAWAACSGEVAVEAVEVASGARPRVRPCSRHPTHPHMF